MDNTDKFSKKADAYTSGRPSYASAFIDALYLKHGWSARSVVADVGSGTGILSKQLLERGSTVYAVEPNDEMRVVAERQLKDFGNFHSVKGTAENTTLEDCSVDYVTVAQAFHWFDVAAFKKECQRILKPNGNIFLIWNTRDITAEISMAQESLFRKYCPDFHGFSGGVKDNDERVGIFFGGSFVREEYDNPLYYDRDKFIQRCLSSSYSLNANDKRYKEYTDSLNGLFDKYSTDGLLEMPNKTVVYHK